MIILALFVVSSVAAVGAQPVEVSNAQELRSVSEDLEDDYTLVDDIDLSEVDNFEPVGECGFAEGEGCASQPFDGTFDGNGHTVSNLTVEGKEENGVGLFGAVGENGSVESIRFEDARVTGNGIVGSLAGTNLGEVDDVHVEGTVRGNTGVGLLVGVNRGVVNGSSATGTVEADGSSVGGLVGSNDGGSGQQGLITLSSAEVEVVAVGGTDNSWVGGLIGANFGGEVRNSRAKGDVRSDASEVGGLAGANLDGEILRTRAEGEVQLNASDVGGLVGLNDGAVTDSRVEGGVTGDATIGGLVGRSSGGEIDGSVVTGTVSGNDEVGGLVGVLGDERLQEGTVVYLRNSRWEVDEPNLPTVAVLEEGNGEVIIENVMPPVERTTENGDGMDDGDDTGTGGNGTDSADNEEDTTTGDISTEGGSEKGRGEGLPGFTLLTALLALFMTAILARRK